MKSNSYVCDHQILCLCTVWRCVEIAIHLAAFFAITVLGTECHIIGDPGFLGCVLWKGTKKDAVATRVNLELATNTFRIINDRGASIDTVKHSWSSLKPEVRTHWRAKLQQSSVATNLAGVVRLPMEEGALLLPSINVYGIQD